MRRRLAFVALAVSSLVVIAFVVPLGILVRNQAENRALTRAERFGESVAAALAVASADQGQLGVDERLATAVLAAFGAPEGVSIVFPSGTVVGARVDDDENLSRARSGAAFTARTIDGAEVLIPVLVADGPTASEAVVVRAFVPEEELRSGVVLAWAMLAALSVFLVGVAVIAADRLGRSMVLPMSELSTAARRLGDGDLETRVVPDGPLEMAEVGEAFNHLARRLRELLSAERESVADLSHRLRTPLTALRLQAEAVADGPQSDALLQDVAALEAAVDRLISEARRPPESDGVTDLATVVRHRAEFWSVLAEDQGRHARVVVNDQPMEVALAPDQVGAVVDTLLENVFGHTAAGTGYQIVAGWADGRPVLVVEDDGPGFPDASVRARGKSGAGSTGLGLDIVSKAAAAVGGEIMLGASSTGGARVTVAFGPKTSRLRSARAAASTRGTR